MVMPIRARLVAVDRVADDAAAFTFELPGPMDFIPGQTCDYTLVNPRYQDDEGSVRTFSIASSPGDQPRITFATRLTGSAFKRSLLDTGPGAEVDIDGPSGSFTLHHNAGQRAVFLAAGIGITPFRSILKDAAERQLPLSFVLLYSNRTPGSTAFLSDLERWRRQLHHFEFSATVTDAPDKTPWPYERGIIDAAFVQRHVADVSMSVFYVAGPSGFVEAMPAVLEEAGADPHSITIEEFPGY
jgi:ferredoxin-NADP reductase